MENYIFWSEIGSGFGEPGGTPPTRIPRSTPQGLPMTNLLPDKAKIMYSGPIINGANKNGESDIRNVLVSLKAVV